MQATSNTVVMPSEACDTAILGEARCEGRKSVLHVPQKEIAISDEQAALITLGLHELARFSRQIDKLSQQINELLRRRARLTDEIIRCYAEICFDLKTESNLPIECGETRCLSRTPCSDTQVDNRPRWK